MSSKRKPRRIGKDLARKDRRVELHYEDYKAPKDYATWRHVCAHAINKLGPKGRHSDNDALSKATLLWKTLHKGSSEPDPTWWIDPDPLGCPLELSRVIDERHALHWRRHHAILRGLKRKKRMRVQTHPLFGEPSSA